MSLPAQSNSLSTVQNEEKPLSKPRARWFTNLSLPAGNRFTVSGRNGESNDSKITRKESDMELNHSQQSAQRKDICSKVEFDRT